MKKINNLQELQNKQNFPQDDQKEFTDKMKKK